MTIRLRSIRVVCFAALLLVVLSISAKAEESDQAVIEQDYQQIDFGFGEAYHAATDRLVACGEDAVPGLVTLLSSESMRTRQRAVEVLGRMGPDVVDDVGQSLLQAIQDETAPRTFHKHAVALMALGGSDEALLAVLIDRLSSMNADDRMMWVMVPCLDNLMDVAALNNEQAIVLSSLRFGEIPDGNAEQQDWVRRVGVVCDALFGHPDALVEFLENHPQALRCYRENEPKLIYLFSDAEPETEDLRFFLAGRDDLPIMFEVDRSNGERVGVVRTHPRRKGIYVPGFLSVIVRSDVCDIPKSPLLSGNVIHFNHGLTPIEVDGLFGFTDAQGQIRVQPLYLSVEPFWEETTWVSFEGKFGKIDTEGNIIVEPRFDSVFNMSNTHDHVSENELVGLVFKDGTVFVEPTYSMIYQSLTGDSGFFIATTPDGASGVIDTEGNFTPIE